jgi:hypothetical protein
MKHRLKLFLLIFFISPFFWFHLINSPNKFITEYSQAPHYLQQKINTLFTNTQYIDEFRWNDVTKDNRPLLGKFFYNKTRFLFDQVIIYLNFLNPSLYFQIGKIEIISCLLFPIFIAGIFRLLKNNQQKLFLIGLLTPVLAFLTQRQNIYFLFPVALFYLYLSVYELSFWQKKYLISFLVLLVFYNLFLFLRFNFIL